MTKHEAVREAQKLTKHKVSGQTTERWQRFPKGHPRRGFPDKTLPKVLDYELVTHIKGTAFGTMVVIEGKGDSWSAALEDFKKRVNT